MAVDTSIYGGLRGPAPIDPLAIQNKVLTLRALQDESAMRQLQMQSAQRGIDQERELGEVFRGATGADGTVDSNRVISTAAERGLGSRIPGLQKDFAETERIRQTTGAQRAQITKTELETHLKRVEARGNALAALANDPQLNHQTVINTLARLVQEGTITSGEGFQATRNLPPNPAGLRDYLIKANLEVMDAGARLKALLPQFELRDTGKAIQPIDVNPMTNPNPRALVKTTTPGEDQQRDTTIRGQNITDKRERDLAAGSVTYLPTEDGSYVALPNRPGAGVVRAQPVVAGAGMQPLRGKLSESQAKEIMSINQQRSIISGGVQAALNTPSAFNFGRGLANKVPLGESIVGRGDTGAEAQARAYVFNNVSRVILERSGTASTGQEAARVRAFMPDDTDNAEQIANKLKGFLTYLDDLEAGTKMPRSREPSAPNTPAVTPPAPGARPAGRTAAPVFEIPEDINAILGGVGLNPRSK